MTALAHGGGAPEAAMIGLPMVLFAVFFALERRARRRDAAHAQHERPVSDLDRGSATPDDHER